jgi:hypothetical protein
MEAYDRASSAIKRPSEESFLSEVNSSLWKDGFW